MGNKNKTRQASFRGRVWKSFPGQPFQQFVSGWVTSLGFIRTGGDDPLYKKRIRAGLNAANDMTVQVSAANVVDMAAEMTVKTGAPGGPTYTFGHEGAFLNVNIPLGISSHSGLSSMSKACQIALRVLNRKITARRRQLQGAVVLGELGKTLAMIVSPAKALRAKVATAIPRLRKLSKRATHSSSAVKTAADTWLELTFGWKPLLADVEDGARALGRVVEKDALERQQFRAYGKDMTQSLVTEGGVGPVGFDVSSAIAYRMNRRVNSVSECILYGAWATKILDPEGLSNKAKRLARLSGFNWEDVAPQAWELIPWSFLVDYFVNIGDVLEGSGNFINGIQWVEEVHIVTTEDHRNYVHDIDAAYARYGKDNIVAFAVPDAYTFQSYKTIARKGYGGDITPSLTFSLPQDLQWLNIAALIAGGRSFQPFSSK